MTPTTRDPVARWRVATTALLDALDDETAAQIRDAARPALALALRQVDRDVPGGARPPKVVELLIREAGFGLTRTLQLAPRLCDGAAWRAALRRAVQAPSEATLLYACAAIVAYVGELRRRGEAWPRLVRVIEGVVGPAIWQRWIESTAELASLHGEEDTEES